MPYVPSVGDTWETWDPLREASVKGCIVAVGASAIRVIGAAGNIVTVPVATWAHAWRFHSHRVSHGPCWHPECSETNAPLMFNPPSGVAPFTCASHVPLGARLQIQGDDVDKTKHECPICGFDQWHPRSELVWLGGVRPSLKLECTMCNSAWLFAEMPEGPEGARSLYSSLAPYLGQAQVQVGRLAYKALEDLKESFEHHLHPSLGARQALLTWQSDSLDPIEGDLWFYQGRLVKAQVSKSKRYGVDTVAVVVTTVDGPLATCTVVTYHDFQEHAVFPNHLTSSKRHGALRPGSFWSRGDGPPCEVLNVLGGQPDLEFVVFSRDSETLYLSTTDFLKAFHVEDVPAPCEVGQTWALAAALFTVVAIEASLHQVTLSDLEGQFTQVVSYWELSTRYQRVVEPGFWDLVGWPEGQ